MDAMSQLVHVLQSDLPRRALPFLTPVTDTIAQGRNFTLIDWKGALEASFYRHRNTAGIVIDEAPEGWGNVLPLQLMLALGVRKRFPHLMKELEAFAPYLLGPPNTSDRAVWEKECPLPAVYRRRFKAVRRRAFLALDGNPDIYIALIKKLEDELVSAHWPYGKVLVPNAEFATAFDLDQIKALPQARAKTPEQNVAVPYIVTGDAEERRAVERAERLGCVNKFSKESKLRTNYFFVRLSSYVKELWDLANGTPFVRFHEYSRGEDMTYATQLAATEDAKRWFDKNYTEAGRRARGKVLVDLGQPDVADHLVLYRKPPAGVETPSVKRRAIALKIYSVNTPETLRVSHLLPPAVRVRITSKGLSVHAKDMQLSIEEARKRFVMLSHESGRGVLFDSLVTHAGIHKFLPVRVLIDVINEPYLRTWLEETFQGTAEEWRAKIDRQHALDRRAKGERVRMKTEFTKEEDAAISAVVRVYTKKDVWIGFQAKWPHHTMKRIRARGHLLLALKQKSFDFEKPVTYENVLQALGHSRTLKYQHAL